MPINSSSLLFKVEQDIASLLLDKLADQEITSERASQISKFVLLHLPNNLTDEQVIQILPSLDDEFIELAVVVHKYMSKYEEAFNKLVTAHMSDLMKNEHFNEASHMTAEYFKKKFI